MLISIKQKNIQSISFQIATNTHKPAAFISQIGYFKKLADKINGLIALIKRFQFCYQKAKSEIAQKFQVDF